MFTWLGFAKALITLAHYIAKWQTDRQLIEAGEAKAIAAGLERVLSDVEKVKVAQRDADFRERVRRESTRDSTKGNE